MDIVKYFKKAADELSILANDATKIANKKKSEKNSDYSPKESVSLKSLQQQTVIRGSVKELKAA